MVYQDRFETNLLQLFEPPETSDWFSIISSITFEVNIVAEQKQGNQWRIQTRRLGGSQIWGCQKVFICFNAPASLRQPMGITQK